MDTDALTFTVVIPTYERRDVVVQTVAALARQRCAPPFEIVVVVDGSRDGTADAVRRLTLGVPLRVLEQENRGAAAARNAGAAAARGRLLLFLDDDMEGHPDLLAEHTRSHAAGADAVLGHMPLHPASPRNVLSIGVGAWAEERLERLSAPGAMLTSHDLLTGQLSVSRDVFQSAGGFDTHFTRDGSFGGEDLDFGYRLLAAGRRIVFNRDAISAQRYVVDPAAYFRQWRDAGRSDAELTFKHPQRVPELRRLSRVDAPHNRLLLGPVARLPLAGSACTAALRRLAVQRLRAGREDIVTRRLVDIVRRLEYLRGAASVGGLAKPGSVLVLAYHAIADFSDDVVLASYAVPPDSFVRHLDSLTARGYRFVSLDHVLGVAAGTAAAPRRGVLVTFDDCYEDLRDVVAPLLAVRGIPAAAFAVSGRLGGVNAWDMVLGGCERALLDAEALRELDDQGIAIGSHTRTHPDLTTLPTPAVNDELAASRTDLAACGLPTPRTVAYPYGRHEPRVVDAARVAGYEGAFTLEARSVRRDDDPFRLPRVEIGRRDGRLRFGLKLVAASAPAPARLALSALLSLGGRP